MKFFWLAEFSALAFTFAFAFLYDFVRMSVMLVICIAVKTWALWVQDREEQSDLIDYAKRLSREVRK